MNKEHLHPDGRPYTKEEFVEKIKTDKEFAKKFGNLGKIYGSQWRNWNGNIDQISELVKQLKDNPDSRRILVSAWNPADLPNQVLPPCHYGFQVYTRELSDDERQKWVIDNVDWVRNAEDPKHEANKYLYRGEPKIYGDTVPKRAISLMYNCRSQDVPLGTPFNLASYGLLLEIIAKTVNMVPDELIGNLGDCHIYLNQIDGVKEQIGKIPWEERKEMLTDPIDIREFGNITPFTEPVIHHWLNYKNIPYSRRMPYPLPTLKHMKTDEFYKSLGEDLSLFTHLDNTDFVVENYQSHPKIYFPLSN
jgi:thymidylate synthase